VGQTPICQVIAQNTLQFPAMRQRHLFLPEPLPNLTARSRSGAGASKKSSEIVMKAQGSGGHWGSEYRPKKVVEKEVNYSVFSNASTGAAVNLVYICRRFYM
jgi:hypothetical protein